MRVGGHDVRDVQMESLRQQIGQVSITGHEVIRISVYVLSVRLQLQGTMVDLRMLRSIHSTAFGVLMHPSICVVSIQVPQDVPLFNDTIYYNIAYGNLSASKGEVRMAVANAFCKLQCVCCQHVMRAAGRRSNTA